MNNEKINEKMFWALGNFIFLKPPYYPDGDGYRCLYCEELMIKSDEATGKPIPTGKAHKNDCIWKEALLLFADIDQARKRGGAATGPILTAEPSPKVVVNLNIDLPSNVKAAGRFIREMSGALSGVRKAK